MDAIILAAGKGTRLKPLTDTIPKPLIPIHGRGTLLRTLHLLPSQVTRVILVVGYLSDKIRAAVGDEWNGRPVVYIQMDVLNGTGGALRAVRGSIVSDRFLVMNGDDLYAREDIERLLSHERGILYARRTILKPGDAWILNGSRVHSLALGTVGEISLINIGVYLLGHEWFETTPVLSPGKTDEWSLPHPIAQLADRYPYDAVEANFWQPCGTFEEIAEAERILQEKEKSS